MKKILITIICLLLLVGCKDKKNNETTNNSSKPKEEIITVKSNNGAWTKVPDTFSDSLTRKELFGEHSISIPNWNREVKNNCIIFNKDNVVLVMLYDNSNYTNETISGYTKTSSKKVAFRSFNTNYEEGTVKYNKESYNYISYYINNEEIKLKLIGISENNKIKELNEMLKEMIESLLKDMG